LALESATITNQQSPINNESIIKDHQINNSTDYHLAQYNRIGLSTSSLRCSSGVGAMDGT
jgi:hypothetical protein